MILIKHRVNTRKELLSVPKEYGVEIDIRSRGDDLILQHEPFIQGERFEHWITAYNHRLIILNVKEEGLENRLLHILNDKSIQDFFFLDQSFPFLLKTAIEGEKRCAARVSEYESIQTIFNLQGMIEWVWVDCFTRFPLSREDTKSLSDAGFKLCLVSPELQGRTDPKWIVMLQKQLADQEIIMDAVCTKFPERWK